MSASSDQLHGPSLGRHGPLGENCGCPVCGISAWTFLPADVVDISGDGDLFVLPNLVFDGLSVTFEVFTVGLVPHSETTPSDRTGGGGRLSRESMARLKAEYPWLTAEDFKEVVSQQDGDGAAASSSTAPPKHLSESDKQDLLGVGVLDALASKREQCYFEDEAASHFYVAVLGGRWTAKYKGTVADAVEFKARAHCFVVCRLWSMPVSKRFTFSAYGEIACHALAREWCRKCSHFYARFSLDDAITDSSGAEHA